MSNAVVQLSPSTHDQTLRLIKSTLFPDASDAEAQMILDYCAIRNINVMLKPIHLTPYNLKTDKKDQKGKYIYEKKRVIMPGIGSYRIDAARTGQYAGISEPEFGPDVTETIGTLKITYPKWCKVVAKRILPNGMICEFTAIEFWKENYASKGSVFEPDQTPNAMWAKRTYGQLAKCAEAQVLRKAFPESISNEPTFEEMDGKFEIVVDEEKTVKNKVLTIDQKTPEEKKQNLEKDCEAFLTDIKECETLPELEQIYNVVRRIDFKAQPGLLKKLIDAKDLKKNQLSVKEVNPVVDEFLQEFDAATGEIK